MHRVLIADALGEVGLERLRAGGCEVVVMSESERGRLAELLPGFDALVVRSATRVTRELLGSSERLRVIGRAGVGVDNVDVAAATERGVLVVNAPTANLMSATEHTFALLLALARRVPAADASMKRGEWDRKSFVGFELQDKALGVVGFGRIGRRVAARARAFEMRVVAFDPFLAPEVAAQHGVEAVALDELLAEADVVTLHTPLTDATRHLMDRDRIGRMKRGALLVNCGRGGTVDEAALLAALEDGLLAGAALDVFEEEPPKSDALVRHPRVIATPHIGAQTREAQVRIAVETAEMLLAALAGDLPPAAVNLPFAPSGGQVEAVVRLGDRLGGLAALLAGAPLTRCEVRLSGGDSTDLAAASVAAVAGALGSALDEPVNLVNADWLAAAHGVTVTRETIDAGTDYPLLVRVRVVGEREVDVAGALFGEGELRVVELFGYRLEFAPRGRLLVVENRDVPGVVGRLGTLLGSAGVNIADIHVARQRETNTALAVLRLDQRPRPEILAALRALEGVRTVRELELGDSPPAAQDSEDP